jgi:hypothetical protein
MGMRFKILMTGSPAPSTAIEVEMLKDKGFIVYTCETQNTLAMILEVHPDILYVNLTETSAYTSIYYKKILAKEVNTFIPVIITLLEDDTYLLRKKNILTHKYRNIICDNVYDAIKIALTGMAKNDLGVTNNHSRIPSYISR